MLNIYRSRETVDKEKFIYAEIQRRGEFATVLVPDQYTLAAERQALSRLGTQVLLEVEILGFSRLGTRVLEETGDDGVKFIDKYGRHMLLSKILREKEDELRVFSRAANKETFIEAINNFISKAKQYEIKPEDLYQAAADDEVQTAEDDRENILTRKLRDLQLIYRAYEEGIKGKFTDTEDLIDLYIEKAAESEYIAERSFWLFGFDSFTPKNLGLIGALVRYAKEVNVVLTYNDKAGDRELFSLGGIVTENLIKLAKSMEQDVSLRDLQIDEPGVEKVRRARGIARIEEELYVPAGARTADNAAGVLTGGCAADETGITLVRAGDIYREAESCASFVSYLLREKGLRYRDIAVICNDQGERASAIRRAFYEWGIDVFDDRKRSLMSSPVAIYITGLMEVILHEYRTGDIFRVLKTGLGKLSVDEVEELENYATKYNIRGSMWKKPFEKGAFEYGDEGMARLEDIRCRGMEIFLAFEGVYKGKKTCGGFIREYYEFLVRESGLGEKITELVQAQEGAGFRDLAEETLQIWSQIMGVMGQIVELMGDEKFSGKELLPVLQSGLSQLEVGVLPPTVDDILLGTMQRTRCGDIKALLVVGANEGLLPLTGEEEILFSREELAVLAGDAGGAVEETAGRVSGDAATAPNLKNLGTLDRIRDMEENLAIYRNLSKPESYLWISYAARDESGSELLPSDIFTEITRILPEVEVQDDVVTADRVLMQMGGEINTLRHYTQEVKRAGRGKIRGEWQVAAEWLQSKNSEGLRRVKEGLAFQNIQEPLPADLARELFHRDGAGLGKDEFSFSPSRLEKYGRCPFDHFVGYGLNPMELRPFATSGRELGDLYHGVLMDYSRKLTDEDRWDLVTREESDELVDRLVEERGASYREGLFTYSNRERYWLRRAKTACRQVCWSLVLQMRAGSIAESFYEESFARARRVGPIIKDVAGGKVYIEGKIDRLDLLEDGRVKIMDYKTGHEKFDLREAETGYRLQLMLYLQAAQGADRHPAGVFYFLIADPRINADDKAKGSYGGQELSEKIEKELDRYFRMNGIMVDEPEVIREVAGDFQGFSPILPLRASKEGIKGTTQDFLLSEADFYNLQQTVSEVSGQICQDILDGKIPLHPKKSGKIIPCTYCDYRSICRFDLNFPGCEFDVVQ